MKRSIKLLFFLSFFSVRALSQEAAVTFLFSSVAPCGGEACVDVTTMDFSNIYSVKMPIKWDPKIVRLKKINFGNLIPNIKNVAIFDSTRAEKEGILFFKWEIDNCDNPDITKDLGQLQDGKIIFSLCFEVLSDYGWYTSIDITDDEDILKNNDLEPIRILKYRAGCTNVGATSKRGNISTCVRAVTISGEPMSGKGNEIICTPVKVTGIDSISGLQFVMQWQDTLLEFVDLDLKNTPITGLSKSSFGLPEDTKKSNSLVFSWNSSGKPVSLLDNSEIFKVCFKIDSAACQKITTIDFVPKMEATSEGRTVSPTTGQDTFRLDVIALVGEEIVTTISRCDPDA